MGKSFVKVKNKEFVKEGKVMFFRGLGIGSWLNLEHFMLGIPTPDNQIRKTVKKIFGENISKKFFENFINNFITEQDFLFMKRCGVNVVRVPFNYRLFIDDQNPYVYKQDGIKYFDYLMKLCQTYHIYLLLDLHTAPGGQNPDWHSDNNTGITQFWHYKIFRDQIVDLWKYIAEHYKNQEYLLGYDILNEPYLIDAPDILSEFYNDITKEIRKVDQNHIIFLEGDYFAMKFDCIHKIYDENTALTFHYYPTVWEPELLKNCYDKKTRCKKFHDVLNKILSTQEKYERPVFCGEAGYEIDKNNIENTMEVLEETLTLFNEKKISWTLWCYKDAQFMGMVYPRDDTTWMQLVKKIHRKWTHYEEMRQANGLMEKIRKIPEFKEASDELCYIMQFRQRGILYCFQTECFFESILREYTSDEWLNLPQSFCFENCGYYQEYMDLLKEKTK